MEDWKRVQRMIRTGQRLRSLVLLFPCRPTVWLLNRQIARLERALPPEPEKPRETPWDQIKQGMANRSPHLLIHRKRIADTEREKMRAKVRADLEELFETVRARNRARSR